MARHIPDASIVPSAAHAPAARGSRKLSRDTVSMVGDLLPLLDFACVLLAAYLAVMIFEAWLPASAASFLVQGIGATALGAAMLAPLILCDRAFVRFASSAQTAAMLRCYLLRFGLFVGVLLVIGTLTRMQAGLPLALLALWATAIFTLTALTRALMVAALRRLEQRGVLAESVAIVGAGAAAERLIAELGVLRRGRVELVGVFADHVDAAGTGASGGDVAALLELGKRRKLDWILIAQPDLSGAALSGIVQRLKALPVPIALWSGDALSAASASRPGSAAEQSATSLPASASPYPLWPMLSTGAVLLRKFIHALLAVPRHLAARLRAVLRARRSRVRSLKLCLDDHDLESFLPLARRFGQRQFGYVVTPNADHLMRLHKDVDFRAWYAAASFVLLDSRFVARLLRLGRRMRLAVCPGSDLTEALLARVIESGDRIVMIGGSPLQAEQLRQRYGLSRLAHHDPPMGFVKQPEAFEACLRFIESQSPFRFCLLAVGSPQQEMLAYQLRERGAARGMALCVGASINFLTGLEKRAPQAMQRMGLEWVFRLMQSPRRMAGRYLVRGPRMFSVLRDTEIVLRPVGTADPVSVADSMPVFRALRPQYAIEQSADRVPSRLVEAPARQAQMVAGR